MREKFDRHQLEAAGYRAGDSDPRIMRHRHDRDVAIVLGLRAEVGYCNEGLIVYGEDDRELVKVPLIDIDRGRLQPGDVDVAEVAVAKIREVRAQNVAAAATEGVDLSSPAAVSGDA